MRRLEKGCESTFPPRGTVGVLNAPNDDSTVSSKGGTAVMDVAMLMIDSGVTRVGASASVKIVTADK